MSWGICLIDCGPTRWDSDSVVGLEQILCMRMLQKKWGKSREKEREGKRKEVNYNFFRRSPCIPV